MSVPTPAGRSQATFVATLVDEWLRAGVTDAVVCPGSRSTPLALGLAARAELRLHVRLDERGAGFFAIGLSLATGRPTLVCTTSGTAAAELHPAVMEAHHAGVPLIVCTADRPPELHAVGAPQTMDQTHLFGGAPRWYGEPGVVGEGDAHWWRSFGSRAVAEATSGPSGPGPVHLNLAFVEPLVADPGPLSPGRPDGEPWHRVVDADRPGQGARASGVNPSASATVGRWVGRRGVVVAGAGCGPADGLLDLAGALGWPVLADPRSRCRRAAPEVVAAADSLVRLPVATGALRPEVVVLLGAPWASKPLNAFVADAAAHGAAVVAVDPWWRWRDPERLVSEVHRSEPASWVRGARAALAGRHRGAATAAPSDWLAAWATVEKAAQGAIDAVLAEPVPGGAGPGDQLLSEPALARRLPGAMPPGGRLVVASSMPVRDLESFAPALDDPPEVLANRGLNGIDGTVGTTLGAAAAGAGPVVGLLGDLAFLHDVSSLVRSAATTPGARCALVVVDNDGGGIFSFLPQARLLPVARFEALFGTPQAVRVDEVARGFGLPVRSASTVGELDDALAAALGDPALDRLGAGTPSVVRAVVPGRPANVELHHRLQSAVADAVAGALS